LSRKKETKVVHYIKKREQRQVEKELRFFPAKGILRGEQSRTKKNRRGAISKTGSRCCPLHSGSDALRQTEERMRIQGGNKSDAKERVGKVRTGGTIL
jgi:hypothetical protein